jgi:hypothetical protein
LPVEDVIQLARHLILHGVMGDQPPEDFEGKKANTVTNSMYGHSSTPLLLTSA